VTLVTSDNGELFLFQNGQGNLYQSDVSWRLPVESSSWHVLGDRDGRTVLGKWTPQGLIAHEMDIHFQPQCFAVHDGRLFVGAADGHVYSIEENGVSEIEGEFGGPIVSMVSWQGSLLVSTSDSIHRKQGESWAHLYTRSEGNLLSITGTDNRLFLLVEPFVEEGLTDSLSEALLESVDGVTWDECEGIASLGDSAIRALDAVGDKVVVVGVLDFIAVSHDAGESWQQLRLPLGMPKGQWDVPDFFFERHNTIKDVSIRSDGISLVGNRGELWEYVFSSNEWTLRNAGLRDYFHDIYREGEMEILVGGDQTFAGYESRIYYRDEAEQWIDAGVYTDGPLYRIINNGSHYIAVGGGAGVLSSYNRARVYESIDGVSWNAANIHAEGHRVLQDATHGPSGTIAVGQGGEILHSTQLGEWTRLPALPTTNSLRSACYAQGRYFIASYEGIWSSEDLSAWTRVYEAADQSGWVVTVLEVLDHVEAVTLGGTLIAIDSDFQVFVKQQLPFERVNKLYANNGSYLAITGAHFNAIGTSSDGVHWDSFSTGSAAMLAANIGKDWVIVGEFGQMLQVPVPSEKHPLANRTERSDWGVDAWVGHVWDLSYPWVYHESLGWVWFDSYPQGVWLWVLDGAFWIWSAAEYYPFVYALAQNFGWYHLGPTHVWSYPDERWLTLEEFFGQARPREIVDAHGSY